MLFHKTADRNGGRLGIEGRGDEFVRRACLGEAVPRCFRRLGPLVVPPFFVLVRGRGRGGTSAAFAGLGFSGLINSQVRCEWVSLTCFFSMTRFLRGVHSHSRHSSDANSRGVQRWQYSFSKILERSDQFAICSFQFFDSRLQVVRVGDGVLCEQIFGPQSQEAGEGDDPAAPSAPRGRNSRCRSGLRTGSRNRHQWGLRFHSRVFLVQIGNNKLGGQVWRARVRLL